MATNRAVEIELSNEERAQLEAWARRPTSAQALAQRSRIAKVHVTQEGDQVGGEIRRPHVVGKSIEERLRWKRACNVPVLAREVVFKRTALLPPSNTELNDDHHDARSGSKRADVALGHNRGVS